MMLLLIATQINRVIVVEKKTHTKIKLELSIGVFFKSKTHKWGEKNDIQYQENSMSKSMEKGIYHWTLFLWHCTAVLFV